jgi:ADP-ribose pyrophosphatase YjhB (NUDIX family)
MERRWQDWVKRIKAIAQNGLTYSKDVYDLERYKELQQIVAEILDNYSHQRFVEIENFLDKERGYDTPKVDVRGVVFQDDKILLVREKLDGKWTLPGGWADVCQSPSENVQREVFEESGYRTKAVRLLAVYDRNRHPHPAFPFHIYKLFFLCEIIGGESITSIETDEVGFFAKNNIPELSLSRVTPQQIDRMFMLKGKIKTEFN